MKSEIKVNSQKILLISYSQLLAWPSKWISKLNSKVFTWSIRRILSALQLIKKGNLWQLDKWLRKIYFILLRKFSPFAFGTLRIKNYYKNLMGSTPLPSFYFNFHHLERICLHVEMIQKILLLFTIGRLEASSTQDLFLKEKWMALVGETN